MRLSELNIGEVIKEALVNSKPSSSFEKIWGETQHGKRNFSLKKMYSIPLIAIIMCMALFTVGFSSYQLGRKVDKIDYPFVADANVIGKWKTVDFVQNIADYVQDKRATDVELYLCELVFITEGKVLDSSYNGNLAYSSFTWTKGKILSEQDKTSSGYDIRDINGKTYLFMQWKSGDYSFNGMEPYFYVLEKVDSQDYSKYKVVAVNEDKIDYPFEVDTQMLGSWESVDFVKDISQFTPGMKSWLDDLFLTKFEISDNGKIAITTTNGKDSSENVFWTKDLIISKYDQTASKCAIKEMAGDIYMFFEWKSGDYIYRGWEPKYYVLKKVN